ncbi:MAG: hypothetical protein ACI81R_001849 [Bradymonadia bacterium]|jgi:hypothetical protein
MTVTTPGPFCFTLAVAAFAALATTGCADDESAHGETPQEEACEHFEDGPFASAVASEATSDLADVTIEHTSVNVALSQTTEGPYVGNVSFAAEDATEYLFMFDADVPVMIFDRDGNEVVIEASESGQSYCDALAMIHRVDLLVGTYTLSFGPTDVAAFNMVHEEAAGAHDD